MTVPGARVNRRDLWFMVLTAWAWAVAASLLHLEVMFSTAVCWAGYWSGLLVADREQVNSLNPKGEKQ